jgi:uncharacterized metal-binding protein
MKLMLYKVIDYNKCIKRPNKIFLLILLLQKKEQVFLVEVAVCLEVVQIELKRVEKRGQAPLNPQPSLTRSGGFRGEYPPFSNDFGGILIN